MKLYILFLIYCSTFFWGSLLFSQDSLSIDLQDAVTNTNNLQNEQDNFWNQFKDKPNINTFSVFEWNTFDKIDSSKVNKIIDHIRQYGAIINPYELKTISELDANDIQILVQYFSFDQNNRFKFKEFFQEKEKFKTHYLMYGVEIPFQKKIGFSKSISNNGFEGDPIRHVLRYKSQFDNDISWGVLAEKDEGEKFKFDGKRYGYDYYSFFLQIKNKKYFDQLIIGSYSLGAGQGLILSNSYIMPLMSDAVLFVKKNINGSRPYFSLFENGGFNGVSIENKFFKLFKMNTFYSYKPIDSKLTVDTSTQDLMVNSFYYSGLHRNMNELSSKRSLIKHDFGCIGLVENKNFSLGFSCIQTLYKSRNQTNVVLNENQLNKSIIPIYNTLNQFVWGVNSAYQLQNNTIFGELALNKNHKAFILGIQSSLSKNVDVAVLYRNYSKEFQNMYANAFSGFNNCSDEKGIYIGLKYMYNKKITINAFYDYFENSYFKYNQYSPNISNIKCMSILYTPNKKIRFRLLYKSDNKNVNIKYDYYKLYKVVGNTLSQTQLFISKEFENNITFSSKLIYCFGDHTTKYGFVGMMDLGYKIKKTNLNFRIANFDIEDYRYRIYSYEKDMPYVFSFPMYYGVGMRYFAYVSYPINSKVKLWIKYVRTSYENRSEVGTGLDKINSSSIDELKILINYKLN